MEKMGRSPHRSIDFAVNVEVWRQRKGPVSGVQVQQATPLDQEVESNDTSAPSAPTCSATHITTDV